MLGALRPSTLIPHHSPPEVAFDSAAPSRDLSHNARLIGDSWVWRDGADFLILDAGPVAVDYLPAHAHCDLLNFELSLDGQRLIVDSGTFDYEDSPMRRYCRSTAAHNVLQIDGVEQCDVWSRFRMGYRGRPTRLKHGTSDGFDWCFATHNAYRRMGVPTVGRWMACRPGGPWFCVDWCTGRGRHSFTTRLHLHPDVVVASVDEATAKVEHSAETCFLSFSGEGRLRVEEGWYCPRFGVRLKASVLSWTNTGNMPAAMAWTLSRHPIAEPTQLAIDQQGCPQFAWCDSSTTLRWKG